MRNVVRACLFIFLVSSSVSGFAKVVVFCQDGFPMVSSKQSRSIGVL
jgi:hypothetical protein